MAERTCPVCDMMQTSPDIDSICAFGCVGYGYVPVQEINYVYDMDSAIRRGTVFPELDLDINEYGKVCKKWGGMADE